jgi:hypothetical protein
MLVVCVLLEGGLSVRFFGGDATFVALCGSPQADISNSILGTAEHPGVLPRFLTTLYHQLVLLERATKENSAARPPPAFVVSYVIIDHNTNKCYDALHYDSIDAPLSQWRVLEYDKMTSRTRRMQRVTAESAEEALQMYADELVNFICVVAGLVWPFITCL